MNLNSRKTLISRLQRGRRVRQLFVESHIAKTIAYQIRATREKLGLTQQQLANEIGTNQNAIYRLESPNYGKATLTTLKRVAAALDVALVVRFVPFSELVDWVSGTPRIERGLRNEALEVLDFASEVDSGRFGDRSLTADGIDHAPEWGQVEVVETRARMLPFQTGDTPQQLVEERQQAGDRSRADLMNQLGLRPSMAKASLFSDMQQSVKDADYGN